VTAGVAVANYDGAVQKLVHEFKVTGSRQLAGVMAQPMALELGKWVRRRINVGTNADGIWLVPAPSRPAATRKRGYLPSQLLAKEVALLARAQGHTVFVSPCLAVTNDVADQSMLSAAERRNNLAGKVLLKPGHAERLRTATAILVDDIVTTGSTLAAMTSTLLAEDIQPEYFLTFAETL